MSEEHAEYKPEKIDWNRLSLAHDLTKRELFAAMAMQALIEDSFATASPITGADVKETINVITGTSLMFADALIKEIEK